jgi:hypothetical protein
VAALGLLVAATGACGHTADGQGRYVFAGPVAATLEIRSDGPRHVVTLVGGGATDAGGAAAADCHVRAVGTRKGDALEAAFTGVETPTFDYPDARAQREGRRLRLAFRPAGVDVTRADVDGYCGAGTTFVGPYRPAR